MENGCKEKSESCEDYDDMSGQMVCLADKAWEEFMKEKMKAVWEKERGANITKAAEVVVKHDMAIWTARMSSGDMKKQLPKEEIEKFKKELGEAFMS